MKVKEETKELESLINATSDVSKAVQQKLGTEELPTELEDPESIFEWDGEKEMHIAVKKARKSIIVLVNSIVPKNYLNSNYIKDKLEQDAQQLGRLLCQQRSIELMQSTNMNAVGKGNLGARMFEVFTLLSKNHSDIAKQISDFQTSLRKSYIDIVLDLKAKMREENPDINNNLLENNESVKLENKSDKFKNVFIGSSDLTKQLQNRKKEQIKEADFNEE